MRKTALLLIVLGVACNEQAPPAEMSEEATVTPTPTQAARPIESGSDAPEPEPESEIVVDRYASEGGSAAPEERQKAQGKLQNEAKASTKKERRGAAPKLDSIEPKFDEGGLARIGVVPAGAKDLERRPRRPAPKPRPKPPVTPAPDAKPMVTSESPGPPVELDGFANKIQAGPFLDPDPEFLDRVVVPEKPQEQRGSARRMIETSVDPRSTFAIDVDTGGYTLARARLREGYRPKAEDVRIEEFLNYFHYDYPEPKADEFSVHFEAAPDPLEPSGRRHLVRIGVKGKSVQNDERPPAHLTFVVDVSGSMFGPDQLGLVIESLDLVTRNLRPDDTIAIVSYATDAEVAMWPAGASERDIVSRAIAALSPGGSSALDEGLQLGYEVASTHFVAGHINRVVLLGDGKANVGERRPENLLTSVRAGVEDGVELSTIGFGATSFNDAMMEQLADRGNGAYYFVDSYREAQKVFGERLCGTLFTIAKDVKIQVEFNAASVVRHRLLGYENRRLEHQQFRDDAVDAGEIGAGHSVTAIYEVELAPTLGDSTIASVNVRYKKPGQSRATEVNHHLFAQELRTDVRESSADFKFAAAVALFAEIARGDEPGGADRMSLLREIAGEGVPRPEEQPDRAEFLALLDTAAPYYLN